MAKLYGSVNGETREVKKLYGRSKRLADFIATFSSQQNVVSIDVPKFVDKLANWHPECMWLTYGEIKEIEVICPVQGVNSYTVTVFFQGGSSVSLTNTNASFLYSSFGIAVNGSHSVGHDFIYTDPTYQDASRAIKKLYGSVNNQSKLIYQE